MTTSELATFLAHSVELESEAGERYGELADVMEAHRNLPVAEFFRRMEREAAHHLDEVAEIAGDTPLPKLTAWEFDWPEAEPPETASYEAVHYRMSLRQAVELALANEQAAEAYYRGFAANSSDGETVRIATRFAEEEASHAAELMRLLASLPENGAHLREEDDEPHMPE
jgi:rubrerythrin